MSTTNYPHFLVDTIGLCKLTCPLCAQKFWTKLGISQQFIKHKLFILKNQFWLTILSSHAYSSFTKYVYKIKQLRNFLLNNRSFLNIQVAKFSFGLKDIEHFSFRKFGVAAAMILRERFPLVSEGESALRLSGWGEGGFGARSAGDLSEADSICNTTDKRQTPMLEALSALSIEENFIRLANHHIDGDESQDVSYHERAK